MDDLICFISQKAFIEKDDNLLILHDPFIGFDLPGGKVLQGEADLIESLRREVIEEIDIKFEIGPPFYTWLFTVPAESKHQHAGKQMYCVGYKCKYLSGEIKLSSEHDYFKWINKENFKQYVNWRVMDEYFKLY